MAAKPWSPSHIAAVAAPFTDLRISGAVKSQLVDLLVARLDLAVPRMEQETLSQDAERKTLDDPQRTRLGYSRTRGLMVERIEHVDSVSAAAVTAACEELESYLREVLRACETVCTNHSMGTIKPRHLEEALSNIGQSLPTDEVGDENGQGEFAAGENGNSASPVGDPLEGLTGGGSGVVTPATLRQMARSFAGMKVDADALEELILLYYDQAGDLQHRFKNSLTGGNPADSLPTLERLDELAKMGFLRRALKEAGEIAEAAKARSITIHHVLELDL
jgi:histone H3/H4